MLINHHSYLLALVLLPIALADNLVLYFPVNPSVPVPESQQDFDQNAPPRVLSRDPDMPSTGIVFIKKTAKHSAPTQFTGDWKVSSNTQTDFNSKFVIGIASHGHFFPNNLTIGFPYLPRGVCAHLRAVPLCSRYVSCGQRD
ncbi:unnamed protein product [Anisakis simplex]|uniref:Secreted protein n=1 Tax=Anisakis simplex TaxID=6269 RepID=A0A0M3J3E4_ANISI|nr:unnamed protein product [Anisakis simplex]